MARSSVEERGTIEVIMKMLRSELSALTCAAQEVAEWARTLRPVSCAEVERALEIVAHTSTGIRVDDLTSHTSAPGVRMCPRSGRCTCAGDRPLFRGRG
jgi:hypothetical protein